VTAGLFAAFFCSCGTGRLLAVRQEPLIQEAEEQFERGAYQQALLKYTAYLYSPHVSKPNEALALYKMGYCQFFLKNYRDASQTFQRFLADFPNDPRAAEVEELLGKTKEYQRQERQRSRERVEAAVREIVNLKQATEADPQDAEKQFQLGESYWKMGQFDDALKAYEKAIELNPRYLEHPSIRKRLIVSDDASLALRPSPVTPKKDGPIRVRNVETKHVKRADFWGVHPTENVYVVSGEVINVGDRTCTNVQVEVTIFDFYENVMDTRMVRIGTMRPGQRRHFVAELNRFAGDPLDIRRYETQVFYEEQ